MSECVCVCVCGPDRQTEREGGKGEGTTIIDVAHFRMIVQGRLFKEKYDCQNER